MDERVRHGDGRVGVGGGEIRENWLVGFLDYPHGGLVDDVDGIVTVVEGGIAVVRGGFGVHSVIIAEILE